MCGMKGKEIVQKKKKKNSFVLRNGSTHTCVFVS